MESGNGCVRCVRCVRGREGVNSRGEIEIQIDRNQIGVEWS